MSKYKRLKIKMSMFIINENKFVNVYKLIETL